MILQPGECWLEAAFDGQPIGRWPVTTRVGEVVTRSVTVTWPPDPTAVGATTSSADSYYRVRVTSVRNQPHAGTVNVSRLDHGDGADSSLEWTRKEGRWAAEYLALEEAGDYRISLQLDPPYSYRGPERLTLGGHLDEQLLDFTIDDDAPVSSVFLSPHSAESGEELLAFEAELTTRDGSLFEADDFHVPGLPVARVHPRNVPFFWTCIAPGRQAACGRWDPDGGDGDIRIEFDVERGWGKFLSVVGHDYQALEGVAVFLDDVPAGSTHSDGRLCLGAKVRPQLITLRYRDWRIDDGMVAADGSYDDSETELNVYLAPPAR
ncbi:MAG: hypothetical protein EXS08_09130 [Planctomycetes bacterium]|nr:hypothetical protein [Planctomycetota bacterium]